MPSKPVAFSSVGKKLDQDLEDQVPAVHDLQQSKEPGLISKTLISWVFPYVRSGFKKSLPEDQMPPIQRQYQAKRLLEQAERLWEAELQRPSPSLWRMLWMMQPLDCIGGVVVSVIAGLLNTVARPLVLQAVIREAMKEERDNTYTAQLIVLFAVVVFSEGFMQAQCKQVMSTMAGNKFVTWSTMYVCLTRVQSLFIFTTCVTVVLLIIWLVGEPAPGSSSLFVAQ
jgi:hypothetical protein